MNLSAEEAVCVVANQEGFNHPAGVDPSPRVTRPIDESFVKRVFGQIGEWICDQTGIEIAADKQDVEMLRNARGNLSRQGKISYRGPVSSTHGLPLFKLDLTADETGGFAVCPRSARPGRPRPYVRVA